MTYVQIIVSYWKIMYINSGLLNKISSNFELNASQHTKINQDQLSFKNKNIYTWFSNNLQ